MVLGGLALLLACTGYAEDTGKQNTTVKKTVTAYFRAEAKGDYAAMDPLFTRDARLKYTYKWGYGYKDTVYELDLSKDPKLESVFDDSEYTDQMAGYETIKRESKIKHVRSKADGLTKVNALVTEKYRYQGYTGTANTKVDILLRNVRGTAKIARLTSVTTY